MRQAEQLLALPAAGTLKGKRDRALLAMLIGCGLRRSEVVGLTVKHIQRRDGRWPSSTWSANTAASVPCPCRAWAKIAIEEWTAAVAIVDGAVFRAITKGGMIGKEAMTAQTLYYVVIEYAARLAGQLGPHDLRRTFGKLAHKGRSPLEQIQLSFGHASLTTTERYLGVRMGFRRRPCDRLGLKPHS